MRAGWVERLSSSFLGPNEERFLSGVHQVGLHPHALGDEEGIGSLAGEVAHEGDLGLELEGRVHRLGDDHVGEFVCGDGVGTGVRHHRGGDASPEVESAGEGFYRGDGGLVQIEDREAGDLRREEGHERGGEGREGARARVEHADRFPGPRGNRPRDRLVHPPQEDRGALRFIRAEGGLLRRDRESLAQVGFTLGDIGLGIVHEAGAGLEDLDDLVDDSGEDSPRPLVGHEFPGEAAQFLDEFGWGGLRQCRVGPVSAKLPRSTPPSPSAGPVP